MAALDMYVQGREKVLVSDQYIARWLSDNLPPLKLNYLPYDWGHKKIRV